MFGASGISIADDGFEWGHGDFDESRYMRSASYDWNGRDTDPSPGGPSDSHGTCAFLFTGLYNFAK